VDVMMLLRQAQEAGLDVRAEAGKLVVRGPKKAEPLARELLDHTAEVLPLLLVDELLVQASEPGAATNLSAEVLQPEIAWRLEAMLCQVPERGVIPFLVARPDAPPSLTTCLSCEGSLADERLCRCQPCSRAAWLAIHAIREGLPLRGFDAPGCKP
jgi:hypothetical protein